jgi:hypothetical protein
MSTFAKPPLENDISITQIWQTLNRNRWLFGLIFVVFMIAGYALWFVLPPIYQARAQINIGKIYPDPFEQPGELVARLMSEYSLINDLINGQIQPKGAPALKSANLSKGTTRTVVLVAEGRERGATQAFLEGITKRVLERHQQIYDDNIDMLTAQLKAMDNHQQALEKSYTEDSQLINRSLNAPKTDSTPLMLLSVQRGQLGQSLIDLDIRRFAIISNLSPSRTSPTVLEGETNAPDRPVAPKLALIMAVAGMLGMIFGTLAAFRRETARAARSTQSTV